ncbi:hypothetical protein GE061_003565 [Apolygus lucorum]|uniref:Telomerase RNA component interacting RNase n=1 Tax=Apolygus lucorum TaxID=248454 RepID=A0A6A4JLY7_APOLU|nr:hypothetical protein GE061_003565 [Apolygus lucorum]
MVYRSSRAPGRSEDDGSGRPHNVFRNDGSFLEMFKKMQGSSGEGEAPVSPGAASPSPVAEEPPAPEPPRPTKAAPFVGKRRGGRVLPTGKVKRLKPESDSPGDIPKDAWSAYLAEVKRYKETTCEEDGKTRPLVK